MWILDWLGVGGGKLPEEPNDTIRPIVGALDDIRREEPERARHLAAFAFMLCRLAYADAHVSDVEAEEMSGILLRHTGLPPNQIALVLEIAKSASAGRSTVHAGRVSRIFGELSSPDQREDLVGCLYAVAAADRLVANVEDQEIGRIAGCPPSVYVPGCAGP